MICIFYICSTSEFTGTFFLVLRIEPRAFILSFILTSIFYFEMESHKSPRWELVLPAWVAGIVDMHHQVWLGSHFEWTVAIHARSYWNWTGESLNQKESRPWKHIIWPKCKPSDCAHMHACVYVHMYVYMCVFTVRINYIYIKYKFVVWFYHKSFV